MKPSKVLLQILTGRADSSIRFEDLCGLLDHLGFERRVRGSHHVFRKRGVRELVNLQRDGAFAKPYQVKQVRAVIVNNKLGLDE